MHFLQVLQIVNFVASLIVNVLAIALVIHLARAAYHAGNVFQSLQAYGKEIVAKVVADVFKGEK